MAALTSVHPGDRTSPSSFDVIVPMTSHLAPATSSKDIAARAVGQVIGDPRAYRGDAIGRPVGSHGPMTHIRSLSAEVGATVTGAAPDADPGVRWGPMGFDGA